MFEDQLIRLTHLQITIRTYANITRQIKERVFTHMSNRNLLFERQVKIDIQVELYLKQHLWFYQKEILCIMYSSWTNLPSEFVLQF